MLWKLADNVKYEDDCEVSVGRAREKKKKKKKKINRAKVGKFGSFKVEFLFYANLWKFGAKESKPKQKEDKQGFSGPKKHLKNNRIIQIKPGL